jgi:hypothetical protein
MYRATNAAPSIGRAPIRDPFFAMTSFRFTHRGWQSLSEFCVSSNSTWGELMYWIKDCLEGRNPGLHWRE